MSHTTKVKSLEIRSAQLLRQTAVDLQKRGIRCTLLQDAVPRMYFQDQLRDQLGRKNDICDYVLKLDGCPYDVGFIKETNGAYTPVFDDYRGHVRGVLGKTPPINAKADELGSYDIDTLLKEYSKNVAMESAIMAGYTIESAEVDAQGQIQITVGGIE